MTPLEKKDCVACKGGIPPLKEHEIKPMLTQVLGWNIIDNHHLYREYTFPDFQQALDFVNKVGEVAEMQNHHPDITLGWGKVTITLYTHKINGLHENDFILAAKINRI